MDILANFPPPIFVNHQIIHNRFVVHMFERKGVIFESNLENIPKGSLVVISAHGTGPTYFQELKKRGLRWIDATCPLVEKVHKEARNFIKQGYHILYIGKKGHQEALGVMDE
jgi:4-hydroxy-3-methylbut-2-enyl diphosphate reductase